MRVRTFFRLPWARLASRAAGLSGVVALLAVMAASPATAQESYSDEAIRTVIERVGEKTGYHFLYRDALIAGKRISPELGEPLAGLTDALEPHGIELRVDSARKQVLLLEAHKPAPSRIVRGVVVDDETGGRLPYATITWSEDGSLRGTVADESGTFQLQHDSTAPLQLRVSYVGYTAKTVHVTGNDGLVPVRLRPAGTFGPEIVVSTAALQTELDTSWHHLIQEGIFAPLGNGGVVRSLQVLPAVSFSTAASSGLNVRGSRADGFQVLLDGMSIYSQSHFFGLFDAFNEDVLQAVGLYYGIPPASLQGPPGGTVSFLTRTGSQRTFRGAVGVGSTSGTLTVEGPLFDGRGSWLVSGRRSHLGLFNHDALIGLGLDVGRETSPLVGPFHELGDRALVPGDAAARFFDVHGKLFHEWTGGARLTLSGYLGGDDARQDAVRLYFNRTDREIEERRIVTSNEWGNAAGSLRLHAPVGPRTFVKSTVGVSRYQSQYVKDDFVYTDPTRALIAALDTTDHVIRPFANENELTELTLALEADRLTNGVASAGFSVHQFQVDYREDSALNDRFGGTETSTQLDVFAGYDASPIQELDLQIGLRGHFFSNGNYLRGSPRARVRLFPSAPLSIGAGYGRNHQFVHRLYLEQNASADVWVLSTPHQHPTSVDHLTGGIYLALSPRTFLQVEIYRKKFENLREHVASAARRRLRPASPILDPWLHDNDGLGRGLEAMARRDFGSLLLSTSYTLSSMEITNPRVNDGEPYAADWDRRHQVTTQVDVAVARGLELNVVWMYATGAPNALALSADTEPARLDPYHRMDLGLSVQRGFAGGMLDIDVAFFNVYDRSNTWYRAPVAVVGRSSQGRRIGLMNVDVYDLGFQPSFEVAYRF